MDETKGTTETLRERAERWIAENAEAMAHFRAFARVMVEQRRRFGIGLLAERVRWEMTVRGGHDDFKVNNNYRAYIARQLIAEMPALRGLLRCRVTPAADLPARESVVACEVSA